MGTDRSDGDSLQGFIVPDSRLSFWEDQSSNATQASPYPGSVAALRDTTAHLSASGTPENADTLQLYAVQGGMTGYDGARFVWREGTSGNYRGWDQPLTLADFEVPGFTASIYGYRHPTVLALADGRVIVAVDAPTLSPIQAHRVQYAVRATDGTWSAWTTLHTEAVPSSLSADYLYPRLVLRDGGVIELYHITYKTSAAQVQRWTSTDGTTWSVDTKAALEAGVAVGSREVRGLKVCYGAGQWLAQLWTDDRSDATDIITIYASRDGATFESQGAITDESRPDCAYMPVQGRFLTVSRRIAATRSAEYREAGSAFSSALTGAAAYSGQAGRQDDSLALAIADDGSAYVINRLDADTVWLRHITQSITAATPGSLGYFLDGDQESLSELAASFARGQLVVASNNDEGSPNSVAVGWYGGYSDLTIPNYAGIQSPWGYSWYPIDELDRGGIFTLATTGSPTNAAAGEFQSSTGSTGDSSTYTDLTGYALGNGLTFQLRVKVNAVNTRFGAYGYASSVLGNYRYGIEVRVVGGASNDTITLYDAIAGTSIASATVTAGSTVEILAAVHTDADTRAWYRIVGASNEDRQWTALGNATGLTQDNSSADRAKNGLVVFASPTGGASSYDVSIGSISLLRLGSVADTLIADPANPADLRGRVLIPREVYVHDGISVRAAGLVRGEDSWGIKPGYSYAIGHALPTNEPSPARGWRSTGTGSTTIAFQLSKIDDEQIGPLLGIYLDRHNLNDLTVQIAHGVSSPTWSTVATSDLAFGAVDYQRAGATVLPRSTTTGTESEFFCYRDELSGGYVRYQTNTVTRQIVRNTEGSWISKSTRANDWPILQLQGVAGSDPSTGASTATGLTVHSRRALVLVHLPAADTQISGIRLTFGGTYNPPQGYWEIGTLAIGAVHVLGWRPDSTRSRVLVPGEVLEAQADGSAYTRRQREDMRRIEIAWTRSSSTFESASQDLDYVKARNDAAALPVAARWLGPQSFRGMLSEVGRGPIVYVPRIPWGTASTSTLLHRYAGGAMLCRFVPDSYRIESVGTQLPEESGEVLRSSVITLEECL
jgi:hypothetical protein